MKSRKLYEAIEKMVNERKCVPHQRSNQKSSFASDYCRQQLIKKKLIPRDPKIKMNKLMKNFQQLQTYVNVDELIECLNQINREEYCVNNPSNFCHEKQERKKTRRYDSEGESLNMEEVNEKLKQYYHIRNQQQREKIENLMPYLENLSSIRKERLKNNHNNYFLSLYKDLSKDQKMVLENGETNNFWEQNKFYEREGQKPMMQEITLKSERKLNSPINDVKKFELLNLAGTYLQIILEKNYRRKWKSTAKGNENNPQTQKATTSTFTRSNTKRDSMSGTASTNPVFLSQKGAKSETARGVKRHSRNKTTSKLFRSQNNTAKNIAMKRINAFLAELDNNQIVMKNSSKRDYHDLNTMKKAMENDFLKYEPIIVDDDMHCIHQIVQRQR